MRLLSSEENMSQEKRDALSIEESTLANDKSDFIDENQKEDMLNESEIDNKISKLQEQSKEQGPYTTVLRWCVVGPMSVNKANLKETKCNNTYVHEANSLKRANHHFALKGFCKRN